MMSHDADLPDTDYASIYGAEALEARRRAELRAMEQTLVDLLQSADERIQSADERTRQWHHKHG